MLKGLVKPNDRISETLREARELDSEEEDDHEVLKEKKAGGLLARDKDDTEARLASMGIGKGKDSSASSIPDQAMINAIRAKRERMRQSRAAAPDFISLDGGSNHGEAEGLSDEEPEFRTRIAMLGEKVDGNRKGVFEDVDEGAMEVGARKDGIEDDEDEEDKIWEEEQFRKGLGKRVDDGSVRVVSTGAPVVQSVPQQNFIYPTTAGYSSAQSVAVSPSIGGAISASHGLGVMSISQQAEVARKAMEENVTRLKVWTFVVPAKLNLKSMNISIFTC